MSLLYKSDMFFDSPARSTEEHTAKGLRLKRWHASAKYAPNHAHIRIQAAQRDPATGDRVTPAAATLE
jgi:hypothetical protein